MRSGMKSGIKFICRHEGQDKVVVSTDHTEHTWSDLCELFHTFLLACGYKVDYDVHTCQFFKEGDNDEDNE